MPLRVNYNILNQKGTPAFYSDIFSARPAFGYAGRVFISTDTGQIFEDTGTAWTLLADAGVGGGTLASVTANGNTTATGIVITANGLSTNSVTNTSLTTGSVLFTGAAGLVTQDNTNLFWDDTNNRLGISTTAPGAKLDIHGANILVQLNGTGTNNSYLQYLNAGATKWQIGNNYNAGANSFDLYNNVLSNVALSVNAAYNVLQLNANLAIKQSTGIYTIAGYNSISCDAGGFFFNCSTANTAYFNLINLTGSRSYTFPDTNGTLALTSQIPSVSGTTNYIPKFTAATTLGNSLIYDSGSSIGINGIPTIFSTNVYFDVIGNTITQGGIIQSRNSDNSVIGSFITNVNGLNIRTETSHPIIFSAAATEDMRITTSGNLLIGTTTDAGVGKLEVDGAIYTKGSNATLFFQNQVSTNRFAWYGNTTIRLFNSALGDIASISNTTGVYTSLSDINKKKDFENSAIGLNAILSLKPTLYRMKSEQNTQKHLGFIAQEVKEFIPQAYVESNEFIGLDYQAIVATLVKSIQELNEKLVRNNIN